jgi:uncharacterized membrane protein YesL
MQNALQVVIDTFKDWYYSMLGLVSVNFLWFALSLTGILIPPATAGVYAVTHSIAHGEGQRISDFWAGMRRYLWLSLRWGLLNALVAAILFSNAVFYGSIAGLAGGAIRVATTAIGAVWFIAQFYFWPFLYEQEDKRLRVALKNALFLTLATPGYTLTLLVIVILVTLVSLFSVLPLAVFTVSFVSLLGNRAVLERLAAFGKLPSGGTHDEATLDPDPLPK